MKRPTDQKLIQKTLEGDQKAFAALLARHEPSLFTRILRKVRYATDAEDLLQEVLVTVYTQLGQLRDQGRFRGWLNVIADNHVRMWQRRRWIQLKWEDRLDTEGNMVFQACDEPLEQQELTTALRAALACLSQAYREVIVHHYYKGYSYLETAELLGLQVNTVRNRLQKGRKRLHKEIEIMAQQRSQPLTFTLEDTDLKALRRALSFTGSDHRQILHGVYLDVGGKIVATNGSRLFLWQTEGLRALPTPILLGPWRDVHIPAAEQATLQIGAEEALLQFPDQSESKVPVMEGPYVHYEKVLPPEKGGQVIAAVRAGQLVEAVERIAPQLAPWHATDQENAWSYTPRVEIRLSALEQTIALTTTRDMGYSLEEGVSIEQPPVAGVDWMFNTSISAQIESETPGDVFRIAVNHSFLSTVVQALRLDDNELINIQFFDPNKGIQFTACNQPQRRFLLMPMRFALPETAHAGGNA